MKKYLKLGIIILGLFLINIIPVSAEEDYPKLDLNVDCNEPSTKCEITSDKFTYKIKKVKLTDNSGSTLSEISNFTIDPEAYYESGSEDGNNLEASALKLNLSISNLDELLKDKDDSFNGFINIEYEANIINAYEYNYKMNGFEGLFGIFAVAFGGLNGDVDQSELEKIISKVTMPVSSNYNHYYVTKKNNKAIMAADKENDTSSDGFSVPLMHFLFSADKEMKVTTSEEKFNEKILMITDAESTDDNYLDDMINKKDDSNVPTVDTTNPKESSTSNPGTAIVSNILIIILLIFSIGLLLITNKKILRKRI